MQGLMHILTVNAHIFTGLNAYAHMLYTYFTWGLMHIVTVDAHIFTGLNAYAHMLYTYSHVVHILYMGFNAYPHS